MVDEANINQLNNSCKDKFLRSSKKYFIKIGRKIMLLKATKQIRKLSYSSTQIISVLFIIVMMFLVGCQTTETPVKEEKSEPVINKEETAPKGMSASDLGEEIKASKSRKIVFAIKAPIDPATGEPVVGAWNTFWKGAKQGGEDFEVNVTLLPNECETCVEDQIRNIADLVDKKEIDGLVIGVVDSIRLVPVIEKAIEAGIPVLAFDTPLNTDKVLSFAVFDNFAGGKVAGEWLVKQLGGAGRVLVLNGPPDHQNAMDRRDGFFAGLKEGEIDIISTASADWDMHKAEEVTKGWLNEFAEIDAIIAANDGMALGASKAIADAKREKIIVVGFDAIPEALEAIKNGDMTATLDQQLAQQGRFAIQVMVRHLETGETFEPIIYWQDSVLVSSENMADYLSD
ncbi:sugar ABC transporter substrate-binding protein [Anaerolineales bacterium HSG24]|nr:sugar ABC transporter substrate-binding protein [Anaerolineales bacterium HSG24]